MFWNIRRIYFFNFSIQSIKINYYISFLIFFPIIVFWWKNYSFPVISINERFDFWYSFQIFFWFFHDLGQMLQLIDKILFYSIRRICIWSTTIKIILWYLWYNKWTKSKTNSLSVIESKLFWYLFLSEWRSSFVASSTSSLIMTSMLLLFECITCSSSLSMEWIKLFAIVNWIFHV